MQKEANVLEWWLWRRDLRPEASASPENMLDMLLLGLPPAHYRTPPPARAEGPRVCVKKPSG